MGGFNVGLILNDLRKLDQAKNKWLKKKGVPKPLRMMMGGIGSLSYELGSEENGRDQDIRGEQGSSGVPYRNSGYYRGKKYKSYGRYGNYGQGYKRGYYKPKSYQRQYKKAYSRYGQGYNRGAYGTKRYGRRRY